MTRSFADKWLKQFRRYSAICPVLARTALFAGRQPTFCFVRKELVFRIGSMAYLCFIEIVIRSYCVQVPVYRMSLCLEHYVCDFQQIYCLYTTTPLLSKKDLYFYCVCVRLCVCTHMHTKCACHMCVQVPEEADPLELVLQAVLSCLLWVLGTEL